MALQENKQILNTTRIPLTQYQQQQQSFIKILPPNQYHHTSSGSGQTFGFSQDDAEVAKQNLVNKGHQFNKSQQDQYQQQENIQQQQQHLHYHHPHYHHHQQQQHSSQPTPGSTTGGFLPLNNPKIILKELKQSLPLQQETIKPKTILQEIHENEKSTKKGILTEHKLSIYELQDYCFEIMNYWFEFEKKVKPNPKYMEKQHEITHRMRAILIDWLVEVTEEYQMGQETLFLAVNYLDRFLSKMSVKKSKLQLLGAVTLFIASKYEEITPPVISQIVHVMDNAYSKEQVLKMEEIVLTTLEFDLMIPTTYDFVRALCTLLQVNSQCYSLAIYLAELSLMDGERYLEYSSSVLATACVGLARFTFHNVFWDDRLELISKCRRIDAQRCGTHLFNSFYEAPTLHYSSTYEKFKSIEFNSISRHCLPPRLPWIF